MRKILTHNINIVHTDKNIVARTFGFGMFAKIETGKLFDQLPPDQKEAVILHERGHIVHRHFLQRIWWLVTFRFLDIEWLSLACVNQEFEADRYVDEHGYGLHLLTFLLRLSDDDGGSFHPSAQERINRLIGRTP